MTDLEKEAKKLIEDFEEKFSYMVEYGNTTEAAIECAIMSVEREIKTLEDISQSFNIFGFHHLDEKQQLLSILKSKI